MKSMIVICVVAFFFSAGYVEAVTWTFINYPGARDPYLYGIDGGSFAGCYYDSYTPTHCQDKK